MLEYFINDTLTVPLNVSVYYKDRLRLFTFVAELVMINKWHIDRCFVKAYNSL